MKRMEMLDQLQNYMDDSTLLEELVRALSDDEAIENFEFIARMNNIDLNEDEED